MIGNSEQNVYERYDCKGIFSTWKHGAVMCRKLCSLRCISHTTISSSLLRNQAVVYFAGRSSSDWRNMFLCEDDSCGLREMKTNPGKASASWKQNHAWRFDGWRRGRSGLFVYVLRKTKELAYFWQRVSSWDTVIPSEPFTTALSALARLKRGRHLW